MAPLIPPFERMVLKRKRPGNTRPFLSICAVAATGCHAIFLKSGANASIPCWHIQAGYRWPEKAEDFNERRRVVIWLWIPDLAAGLPVP